MCDPQVFGGRFCCFGGRSEGGVIILDIFMRDFWCFRFPRSYTRMYMVRAEERLFEDITGGC